MYIYNSSIEAFINDENELTLFDGEYNKEFKVNLNILKENEPIIIGELEYENQLLLEFDKNNLGKKIVYVIDKKVFLCHEKNINELVDSKNGFNFQIYNTQELFTIKKIGISSLGLFKNNNELIFIFDGFLTDNNYEEFIDLRDKINFEEFLQLNDQFYDLSKIEYFNMNLFVYFDRKNIGIKVKKISLNPIMMHETLEIELLNIRQALITYQSKIHEINIFKLGKGKYRKIFSYDEVTKLDDVNILGIFSINKVRYFIYQKTNGVYIGVSNVYNVTGYKPFMKMLSFKNSIYFVGRYTHYALNANNKYNTLYLNDEEHKLTEFKRFFPKIPLLRRYGYFKVRYNELYINDKIHNNFFVGTDKYIVHNLKLSFRDKKVKTLKIRKNGDQINVIRTNLNRNICSTIIPFSEEYSLINRIKIKVAQLIGKLSINKNVNLYFEKKSMKADESSIRVFEEVMKRNSNKKNYFVISKDSDHYPALKEKYNNNIIEKFSFKHYLSIFKSSHFIASELSNHLVNDRLYIDALRNKLMRVPLIFLQHGIMFAKPVDNPMAMGFHKSNNAYNIKKSVISSELEATQFYKMGYDTEDLLLTGLATFDFAYLNEGANKIAYMPTYRYWEEGLIYKNEIENTSYYKSIMKVIKAFEKEGLIDRLLIVPHNKFSQFIYENMPKYKDIISDNPSEALKISKIFITDYSSAIYDATFRGAYPIFYWEEKEYLIENYKAIPPVNEENAPGDIVYSVEKLIERVKYAIENDYKVSNEIQEKYLAINSFTDRRNTIRIVDYLEENNII